MRRTIPLVVAVLSLLFQPQWLHSSEKWTPASGNPDPEQAELKILSNTVNEIVFQVDIKGIVTEDLTTKGGQFLSVTIPGEGYTSQIGLPQLPVMRRLFESPSGSALSVSVTEDELVEYRIDELGEAARIIPLQEPLLKVRGAEDMARFSMDESRYRTDEYWPAIGAEVREAGYVRGHRVGVLELSPVSYNPVRSVLKVVTKATVRIEMKGGSMEASRRAIERAYSPPFEDILGRVLINYPLTGPMAPPGLPVGYLVIVHDDFTTQIESFTAWKKRKGLDVTVTPLSDISPPTNTGIQAYIQDAYDNWTVPPTYVLLVGDYGYIPTFQGSDSYSASDLYYSTMNPEDILPDLSVGRLPARNTTDINNMISKIMDYEYNIPVVSLWQENATFMASLDNYQISEGTHNYVISNYLEPAGLTCHTIYARLGGDTQDITDNLNEGRTIANYSGHGDLTYWYNPGFTQANINALSNSGMYPFVVSNACLTGDFEVTECFGETWLKASSKGAIGFWGASTYTYWDEDDILERRLWEIACVDSVFEIGRMTDQALIELYQYYGGGGLSQYYLEAYNVLGDPSIDLWTDVVAELVTSHPSAIILGTVPVTVSVSMNGSALSNALVCLNKEGEVFETGYTDNAGMVTLSVTTSTPGDMNVTVTAHNGVPYEGTISVVPPVGAYVVLEDYAVDDSTGGNGDGTIDFGETIALQPAGKNVGVAMAAGVAGLLRSDDPYITISDSIVVFGDINPDETVWAPDAFDFDVSADTPDEHTVSFTFLAADENDSVWTTPFSVTCQAPVLMYESHTVDDSFGGDGNGEADPGETVDIYVTLSDEGTGEATGVWADLACTDPYLTITEAHAEYPDVNGGESVTSVTGYRVEISPDCPQGYFTDFQLDVGADGPYSNSDGFELLIGQKPILLVDDDDGANYQIYFTNVLDALGYPYDIWDHSSQGTPTLETVSVYRTVIWTTADDYGSPGTLTLQDETVLMSYLDGGGTLFLSSQDFLYDNGLDTFATQYLHVSWFVSDENITQVTGIEGDPIGQGMTINLNYPFSNWSDDMLPDGQAATVFENTGYNTITVEREGGVLCPGDAPVMGDRAYSGAIRYPSGGGTADFKTVFFAFSFDAIPQGTVADTVMDNVLQWLWQTLPNVSISLDPDTTSVPQGGTLGYTLTATNNTTVAQTVSYWTNITLPGGGIFPPSGYLMGPFTGTMDPGQVINVHISHEVPTFVPPLNYTYNAFAGSFPSVWDQKGFDFNVYEAAGNGRIAEGWNIIENGLQEAGFILEGNGSLTLSSSSPLPRTYAMFQNYPNPFNPQTAVRYDVPESVGEGVRVLLRVFSVRGRMVSTLVDRIQEPGRYIVYWNGRSDSGEKLPSGVYIYRMEAGDFNQVRKMVMVK